MEILMSSQLRDMTQNIHGMKICDMSPVQLEQFLLSVAECGASSALDKVGLSDEFAGSDIRDIRSLLKGYRVIRKGALQQLGRVLVWLVILLCMSVIYSSKTTTEIIKHLPLPSVGE